MKGKISHWKNDKGFGFILPDKGTEKIFFHISSVKTRDRRPQVGDSVLYDSMRDSRNRLKAKAVVIEGVGNKSSSRVNAMNSSIPPRKKSSLTYFLLLLFLSVSLAGTGYVLLKSEGNENALTYGSKYQEYPALTSKTNFDESDAIIANAFSNHISNLQVSGQGIVTKILPDDNIGSRHQKFIIKLSSGQTLLIAHNIDLSDRIGSLQGGDSVQFYGKYEWNDKGGVIHWTHRDPNGYHEDGWLQHKGKKYQ